MCVWLNVRLSRVEHNPLSPQVREEFRPRCHLQCRLRPNCGHITILRMRVRSLYAAACGCRWRRRCGLVTAEVTNVTLDAAATRSTFVACHMAPATVYTRHVYLAAHRLFTTGLRLIRLLAFARIARLALDAALLRTRHSYFTRGSTCGKVKCANFSSPHSCLHRARVF